jgi:predicted component of type VI protein secretion system
MARPPSWLPRLHEIRRSVNNSVRSHYDRADLQNLFKLQPRAANALLAMLPTVPIGRAHLVEREALARFLDRVHEAEDAAAALGAQRNEKQTATRRKPRALVVRRDHEKVHASTLGRWMARGHLHVDFQDAQELFDVLWRVASALQEDLEAFVELYEPRQAAADPEVEHTRSEVAAMFEELEQMEKES